MEFRAKRDKYNPYVFNSLKYKGFSRKCQRIVEGILRLNMHQSMLRHI